MARYDYPCSIVRIFFDNLLCLQSLIRAVEQSAEKDEKEVTLATKTVIIRGTMSCMAPVVSITITVVVSVILVDPPMKAAAPICKERQSVTPQSSVLAVAFTTSHTLGPDMLQGFHPA